VRWIATGTYYGHFHSTFLYLFKRKVIQFCAYSKVLIFRMDGEQVNFSSFIFVM